ncbi:hypothetical protein FM107_20025 [Sphingobacterium sp. JB170]|nr:hypothetical protein FM107_20025 [Sphingobacterium sp. JB170]
MFKDISPEEITLSYNDRGGKEIKYTKVKTLQFPLQWISLGAGQLESFKVYSTKMSAQQVARAYQSQKQP